MSSHLFYQSRLSRPMLDRAEGIYLWDTDGNRYLDGSSGAMVSNIGHSNPRVLAAMQAQMAKSTFGYRLHFQNQPAEDLARMTAEMMPEGLDRVFFVSGGSEAVESAIKLARQYALTQGRSKAWKVISRFPSYHGSTLGALAITGMDSFTGPFEPMMRMMPRISAPTCYLDRDNLSDHDRGLRYAEMLRDEIIAQGPETVLAFIMEPVGGASTHCVLTAHSGMRNLSMFDDIHSLEPGDLVLLHTMSKTLAYKMVDSEVVLPEEMESLTIEPGADKVTLVTCTPYGVNDHRLLVHCVRTKYNKKDVDKQKSLAGRHWGKREFAVLIVVVAIVLLLLDIVIHAVRKRRKAKASA